PPVLPSFPTRRSSDLGRRIWNKTKKRDTWGQEHRQNRPLNEWLTIDAEALRIVPEAVWNAAHNRLQQRRAIYVGFKAGQRSDCRDRKSTRLNSSHVSI